jgi:hypothetical protein
VYEWLQDQEDILSLLPASDVSTQLSPDELSAPELWLSPSEIRQKHLDERFSGVEAFLIESLAQGLLAAYDIEKPAVPVRQMIRHPLPIFERLNLLELRLGLYDVTYRSLPNGSRVIVVDLARPFTVQRVGMARELYIAFCRSARAVELNWFGHKHPNGHSDLFARNLLMPSTWVKQARAAGVSWEDLAERFGVPIQMATQRQRELQCESAMEPLGGTAVLAEVVQAQPWL